MARFGPAGRAARSGRRRGGAAVVEFAFVIVFLTLLVVGMAELGRAVMVKTVLTDASRKGASTAVAANKTYADIQSDVDDILATDAQLPATLANGKATLTVTVAAWNTVTQSYGPDVVVSASTFAPNPYDKVSVTVSVNAADVTWLVPFYTSGRVQSEAVVMMKQ